MTYRKFMLPAIAALALSGAQLGWAQNGDDNCDEEYDVDFFAEINGSDGDAGVQLKLDGEQWDWLEIFGPDDREVLDVRGKRNVGQQGLTEFFFESAEPSFDDQSLEEFLELFPEGEYEFVGQLVDGGSICADTEFTHDLPAAPDISVALVGGLVVISWDSSTDSFPGAPEAEIEVETYEVIAGNEDEGVDFAMIVSADTTQVTLPPEFPIDAGTLKYEVIRKEASGNQTLSEESVALPLM